MKPVKTRNSNTWTEAKFNGFIKSLLRKGTMRWGPINVVKKSAWVERGKYLCAGCDQVVPLTLNGSKNVFVDHVKPVVDPAVGFKDWDTYISRMFCEQENLQVLCKACHDVKSSEERLQRSNK
jgi:5-methylcytosine-specific restriction endonuclease McrA